MNLEAAIIDGLKKEFGFRKIHGEWMQEGKCPQCGKNELFAHAKTPKMVHCGRMNRCNWSDSVRNCLPDLFEDWSKRFEQSEDDPNAAADAYLQHERGLDMRFIRGTYSQELYRDKNGSTSATIRFPVGESWWERLIDRVGRFDRKAKFEWRGKWRGHCWLPNTVTFETLADAEEIWIAEGIFDAVALLQGADRQAVSNMSTGPYPEHFLGKVIKACEASGRKDRPRLVFAFDVGAAGVFYSKKHIKQAREEGWIATCAQVRPDGEGSKLDWNDLLLRQQSWKGDPDQGPLGEAALEEYLHNGAITIAETAREKAQLIVARAQSKCRTLHGFDFRHDNRIYWCPPKFDEDGVRVIEVHEIANCAFDVLYREYDPVDDLAHYYLRLAFPFENDVTKARFSAAATSNSAEFKKRLMTFAGIWTGTGQQLDRIMARQLKRLKMVEPLLVLGYSPKHEAWLLGDIAVRHGRILQPNDEDYFQFGKASAKLASPERVLDIEYDADTYSSAWIDDIWTAYGPRGLVVLAFFVMSLFAVQIRKRDGSLGFLEATGVAGAGKTLLFEFCWKLFGRAGYEGLNPNNSTVAGLTREFVKVSNLPVGIIESQREDEPRNHSKKFDYDDLLVLFNGRAPRTTGRRSRGYETDNAPFLGSIYLMQNERIDAREAILERLMSFRFDKSRFGPEGHEAATRLRQLPLDQASGTIIHCLLSEEKFLTFHAQRTAHHVADIGNRKDGLLNDRVKLNFSQLAAAVEGLRKFFPECRPEWIKETLAEVDAMALDRQNSASSDHHMVADFWDKVDFLIAREADDAHSVGASINRSCTPATHIAVNLPDFEARCRNAGLIVPDMVQLKRLLRSSKSRKFLRANHPVRSPADKTSRCWLFAQPAAAERPII